MSAKDEARLRRIASGSWLMKGDSDFLRRIADRLERDRSHRVSRKPRPQPEPREET